MVQTICVRQMNQTPGGDDSDNSRPQRHLVVDEDDVGATPFRENTAIGETCGSGGRRRNQVPSPRKRQHTVGGKPKCRQQRRRIVLVGRED